MYDIYLEKSSTHIFPINGYALTHNCGGGNTLAHPQLLEFIEQANKQGLICNITVNQKHLKPYHDQLVYLIDNSLVRGIGISYSSAEYLPDIKPLLQSSNNIVFHLIAGLNQLEEITQLNNFCKENSRECKILILGYKKFGFGINYYLKNNTIEDNKYRWYTELAGLFGSPNLILSFDNLAIRQLALKRYFTPEGWSKFYMGDDGKFSCYIDGVNQQFAISSTSLNRVSFDQASLLEFFNQ